MPVLLGALLCRLTVGAAMPPPHTGLVLPILLQFKNHQNNSRRTSKAGAPAPAVTPAMQKARESAKLPLLALYGSN